jgi:hypothetical protein
MVDTTSCHTLAGTVRIDTRTDTLEGTLNGTREDCADTRPLSGTIELVRIP